MHTLVLVLLEARRQRCIPELDLTGCVACQMWVLGTEFRARGMAPQSRVRTAIAEEFSSGAAHNHLNFSSRGRGTETSDLLEHLHPYT